MTTSQDWWPADYGHYGPLFIRMTWHAAGTYRIADGRGGGGEGMQRFAPLNSWPDNANLDKARRLLWPVKQKYGRRISWADLIVFAGNVALESMGFETFGFGFGREDVWEPDEIFWGPEDTWLGDERYSGERDLSGPLGAVQMGLIYVNPEGPNGNPDPLAAAHDIRETFARMAMNDEETVALIVGGHSFGKCHGAGDPDLVGTEPEGCPVEAQGLGWKSSFGSGIGTDAITSGLEGAWTNHPTEWDNGFLDNLYGYEWELTESPAGAKQWKPTDPAAADNVPDAQDPSKRHAPMMLTTDLALRMDPVYAPISKRFHEHPEELADAFAQRVVQAAAPRHGPGVAIPRSPGSRAAVVAGPRAAGGPRPRRRRGHHRTEGHDPRHGALDLAARRHRVGRGRELPPAPTSGVAPTARVFVSRRRRTGRSTSRRCWPRCCPTLEQIQRDFNGKQSGAKRISLADLIVLAGSATVEQAARDAGIDVTVPFAPGRTDASQEQTDVDAFAVLEPIADGFRNYQRPDDKLSAETRLLDRANLLSLTAAEMTVLVGGMRALDANCDRSALGVLTDRPGSLTNDFFVNLLASGTEWKVSEGSDKVYEGRDVESGTVRWTATAADLVFGSNSVLRSLAEVYAADDADERFVARLRRRVGQGHEPRPLRPRLSTPHRSRVGLTAAVVDVRGFAPTSTFRTPAHGSCTASAMMSANGKRTGSGGSSRYGGLQVNAASVRLGHGPAPRSGPDDWRSDGTAEEPGARRGARALPDAGEADLDR